MEFSLHTYLQGLRAGGASDDFIEVVRRTAKPLADVGLPVILTLGQLAYCTEVPYRVLIGIISRQVDPYRVFAIRKRNGAKRFICVAEYHLLQVQRWIHEHILCSPCARTKLSVGSTAYARGCSHKVNAKRHLGAEWLLKLDITNFFESISERQVYRIFRSLGYAALVSFGLTRLCTRALPPHSDQRLHHRVPRWQRGHTRKFLMTRVVGHLPQGAPTSPMLANLVCASLDLDLQKIGDQARLIYSRYADDMTFSGDRFERSALIQLIREVSEIVGKYGFGVNSQKTSVARTGGRKIVTGPSVEADSLRVPRSYKDSIRKELYYLGKYGLASHCSRISQDSHFSYLRRLAGRIRYVASIERSVGQKMASEFERLFPDFREVETLASGRPR
jgi:RNA-directed DNA polymerase